MGCEMTIFVLSEYRPESIAIIWRQMCRWSSCYNSAQTKEATVRLICIQFLISAVQLSVISERNRRQRQHMNTAVAVGRGSSRPQHQYYIWRWFVNVPNENTYNVIILLHCVPVAFCLIVFVVLFFFFFFAKLGTRLRGQGVLCWKETGWIMKQECPLWLLAELMLTSRSTWMNAQN